MDTVFYGLDPLFWVPVKATVADVLAMAPVENRQGVFKFLGHLVRSAEIHGLVVAVTQTYNIVSYTVDDGTGTLLCCRWKDSVDAQKVFALGTSVRVTGFLSDTHDVRQLQVDKMGENTDPNRELSHALEAKLLKKKLYQRDFGVPTAISDKLQDINAALNKRRHEEHTLRPAKRKKLACGVEDQQFLLEYLKKYYADGTLFDVQDLRSEGDLSEEFQRHQATTGANVHLKQFLEVTIKALRDMGAIEAVKKREQTKHRLVNMAGLEKKVIDIVRASQQKESTLEYGGTMTEYILAKVLEHHSMSKETLIIHLQRMVNKGLLYMSDRREYMVLD
ncbi:hypothetical protein BC940DRAFT_287291 [Gongronella butleri]|nr:hypothetical protein BC940DRAFT_287291 [Gongronella butleri]